MFTDDAPTAFLTHLAARLVWRKEAQIAERLDGFASTEAGSALDMLKAAELEPDPKLRRLFFRHAIDEARHARAFQHAARGLTPRSGRARSEHVLIRATRQNLYARLGRVRFVAFVALSERRAARQFTVLARHFERAGRGELAILLDEVLKDERFHVAYSEHLLEAWRREGRAWEVRAALIHVTLTRGWHAWRRAGRVLGDLCARALLLGLYALIVPPFALLQRALEAPTTGFSTPLAPPRSLGDARKQG